MQMERLKGQKLLIEVRRQGDASADQIMRACGYVSFDSQGIENLDHNAFYDELVSARIVEMERESTPETSGKDSAKQEKSNHPKSKQDSIKDLPVFSFLKRVKRRAKRFLKIYKDEPVEYKGGNASNSHELVGGSEGFEKLASWCGVSLASTPKERLEEIFISKVIDLTYESLIKTGYTIQEIKHMKIVEIYPLVSNRETKILNALGIAGNELMPNRTFTAYDLIIFKALDIDYNQDSAKSKLGKWWSGYFNTRLIDLWNSEST